MKYTEKKLAIMPYAQAHVRVYDDGTIQLISYTTVVVTVNSQGWLSCHGLYSQTTRRHISVFMAEYTHADYYTAKMCYEKSVEYNIYTGEIK